MNSTLNENIKITKIIRDNLPPRNTIVKTIYLPFFAKRYFIPEEKSVDILEQLILSLGELKSKDNFGLNDTPFDKLKKIGFPAELLDSVFQVMKDDDLIDEKGILKKKSKNISGESDSKNSVFVFKDASKVNWDIVPYFSIEDFQTRSYSVDTKNEYVVNIDANFKISPVELIEAIKIFKRNYNNYGGENFIKNDSNDLEEEFDDEEISWNSNSELSDTKTNYPVNTGNRKYLEDITPADDKIQIVYFATNIYFDIDCPDRIYMQSPFGEVLDPWFDKFFLRLQNNDSDLKDFVDKFFYETMKEAKKSYAFNNDLNIELFKQYPVISNEEKYSTLKKEIESMVRAKIRIIENKETDYDTFYMRCNRVMECIIKLIVQKLSTDEKQNIINNIHNADFRYQVLKLTEDFGLMNCENYQILSVDSVKNVLREKNFYVKAGMLILLFDAHFNQRMSTVLLFRDYPQIFSKVSYLVDIRNKFAGHHSEEQTKQDENSERNLAKKIMEMSEEVITALVAGCIVYWE